VIDKIVDIGHALPTVQVQGGQRNLTRIDIKAGTTRPRVAILRAMNTKIMQMHVAPGKDKLQCGMKSGEGHIAANENTTPDQRADALHNHPELIDIWWGKCIFHGRSVPQGSQDLKWLPPKSNALIVGEMPEAGEPAELSAVQREDDSWLVDGMMPIDEFKDLLRTGPLPDEAKRVYQTVAGFVMLQLGRIPAPSDHRIDKLLVTPVPSSAPNGKAEPEDASRPP
jgi:Transporter associated domain